AQACCPPRADREGRSASGHGRTAHRAQAEGMDATRHERLAEVYAEASHAAQGQRAQGPARRAREWVVRFWDSSAIVPLVLVEPATTRVRAWLREDATVAIWTFTRVEVLSALARRRRAEPRMRRQIAAARHEFLEAWPRWSEVTMIDAVKRLAERLVETHPLRAAHALQLGSGRRGKDAVEVAREMLATYGSLSGVAGREVNELARLPGVGRAKAARLVAAFELTRRLRARTPGARMALSSPGEVYAAF